MPEYCTVEFELAINFKVFCQVSSAGVLCEGNWSNSKHIRMYFLNEEIFCAPATERVEKLVYNYMHSAKD